MNKRIALSLLITLLSKVCLATGFYEEISENIRFRGKPVSNTYHPLPLKEISKTKGTTDGFQQIILQENLFSSLGDVWKSFKESDFQACLDSLIQLQLEDNPQSCHLLGFFYEKGLGNITKDSEKSISYYTRSAAAALLQENTPLYLFSIKSLENWMNELCPSSR